MDTGATGDSYGLWSETWFCVGSVPFNSVLLLLNLFWQSRVDSDYHYVLNIVATIFVHCIVIYVP